MMRPGIWNKVAIEEARSRHEPRLTIKAEDNLWDHAATGTYGWRDIIDG